jgi:DNA polymerase-3 subunit delta'
MMAADYIEREAWPAPRETARLVGHGAAEQAFLSAFRSGRMPHAWLITGPEGVGKATLAFRMARFVLGTGQPELFGAPARDLESDPSSGLFRRVASGAHADLMTVERGTDPRSGRTRSEIVVDDVRKVSAFLHMTPAESRWRVVVVDCVDEMNRHAANALLKILEEPPPQSLLLLVSHAPGRLLATIRSRCRRLTLGPLAPDEVEAVLAPLLPDAAESERAALVKLSEGSPGRALRLAAEGGIETYREMLAVIDGLPALDVPALHRLSERLARAGGEPGFRTALDLLCRWLVRLVRFGAHAGEGAAPQGTVAEGEAALMRRLAADTRLDRWVEVWEKISRLAVRTESVNLDRKQVVLSAFFALAAAARG